MDTCKCRRYERVAFFPLLGFYEVAFNDCCVCLDIPECL